MTNREDERYKKIGKLAIEKAKEMLKSLPEDAEYVHGTTVLSKREVMEKLETDEEFAAKNVERILRLKLRKGSPEE